MNLLITAKSKSDNSLLVKEAVKFEADVTIELEKEEVIIGGETKKFKNALELVSLLEEAKTSYENICMIGGILSFSSEINIRTLFSAFSNLVKKTFVYADEKKAFDNKVSQINRCLASIDSNPSVVNINTEYLAVSFEKRVFWQNYSGKVFLEGIQKKFISEEILLSKVSECVAEKKPFSLIRVNHCENRIIGQGFSFDMKEAEITYDIQFGYYPDQRETQYITYRLKDALINSDVIGSPTPKTNSSNRLHLLENSTFIHLNRLSIENHQEFTDVNCHYKLGKSKAFKKILADCKKLHVITCRNIERLERALDREIAVISIPAENRFSNGDNNQKLHFPFRFDEVEEHIRSNVSRGDVVLVGAGILGKIYCDTVKMNGGIAIDVGSLMDAVEGLSTRGEGFSDSNFWWL